MRLTHLKLAGFKSFVDPTTIQVPGQLVGVVGPNGCGKSNIIDAVRWVLGESRAAALRGESMQDVIFNGSSLRKPTARASVELIFDNSLGRAAGQWSQYAEIAVKRVLTREGDSSYYVNNTQVRRRDVQDIFLGTGVGPRAYAIIEQGMISRVIDAKPEDLRVFLEEAAGVSKYKERRRETEHRLEDTRENLSRVDDIRRELESQIEKLARQADVAREFQGLKAEQTRKQQFLWLLRKRDAEAESTRITRDIEGIVIEVEAQTAKLRQIERHLELTRTQHYGVSDAVNTAQGVLYGVNSEIAKLEAELKFITDTRQRLLQQGIQLVSQLVQWGRQSSELREALGMWRGRRTALVTRQEDGATRAGVEKSKLTDFERVLREAQSHAVAAREAILEVQRQIQVEEAHRSGAQRGLGNTAQRRERLNIERTALAVPDAGQIAALARQLHAFDAQIERLNDDIRALGAILPELEAGRADATAQRERLQRDATHLEGRLATLRKIQNKTPSDAALSEWLERMALASLPRVWQSIKVEPGWETAVEAVLRERLQAITVNDTVALGRILDTPPPKRATIALTPAGDTRAGVTTAAPGRTLASLVTAKDSALQAVLDEWLGGMIAVDADAPSLPSDATWAALPPGTMFVTRAGHQLRRYSIAFYGEDEAGAGMLARQREIDGLASDSTNVAASLENANTELAQSDAALRGATGRLNQLRASLTDSNLERHRVELDHLKLTQLLVRVAERATAIEAELAEVARAEAEESERLTAAAASLTQLGQALEAARAAFSERHALQQEGEQSLTRHRVVIQAVDRDAQEAVFAVRECDAKIDEVARSLRAMLSNIDTSTVQERALRGELRELRDAGLRERLQLLLAGRTDAETALASVRDQYEGLTTELRGTEEARLAAEQGVSPLREQINELRLREQAARLGFEQFSQQLTESGADEAALGELLAAEERLPRPNALSAEINRLTQAIAALGAINMAALDELSTGRERKDYLDAQSNDLAEALSTLEAAIKRIDIETRQLLQQTFDTVNKNFGELFPLLFGGGQAKLVMTGDEVLDAGVQVMAQPPGKRNQSIQLLSGGEKALTAISLIFSMFKLNPAPFCLLDEVDAPLDETNTERFCNLVRKMAVDTQFLFISHSKITMEMAGQLIGVTMQEQGVSRIVAVDIAEALKMREAA